MPGNLGAGRMAELLVIAKNSIFACCRDNDAPISANIHRDGAVQLVKDVEAYMSAVRAKSITRGALKLPHPFDETELYLAP